MLGVGFGDKTKNRRQDHVTKKMIESYNKNDQLKIFYHV